MANGVTALASERFTQAASKFTTGPLPVLGLMVICWGVLAWHGKGYDVSVQNGLVRFLISSAVLLFVAFIWLVRFHPEKIWGASEYMKLRKELERVGADVKDSTEKQTVAWNRVNELLHRHTLEIEKYTAEIRRKRQAHTEDDPRLPYT